MRTIYSYFTVLTMLLTSILNAQNDIIYNRDAIIKSTEKLTVEASKGLNLKYSNGSSNLFLGSSESRLFAASKSSITGYGGVFLSSYTKINLKALIPVQNGLHTTLTLNPKAVGIDMENTPSTIGTIDLDSYKLFVNGGVLAKEVRVRTDWADYVFDPSYTLRPLPEVAHYIQQNGHLPNVPDTATVAEEGIEIGDMTRIQQEKIEELTLYTIQQDQQITTQQARIDALEERLMRMEDVLKKVKTLK